MAKNKNAVADRKECLRRDMRLVKKTLAGDGAAFAELMSIHRLRVRKLGMSFFKNEADTDDFEQDVFIKAFTHLSSFKGKSLFSTWLLRIGWTTAVNSVNRRKEYLPLLDEDNVESTAVTPEEKLLETSAREAAREAMEGLPEKYKACVDMFFFYGQSYQEISEITGVPLNTVKSNIFRAKKLLKEKLEDLI